MYMMSVCVRAHKTVLPFYKSNFSYHFIPLISKKNWTNSKRDSCKTINEFEKKENFLQFIEILWPAETDFYAI